MIVAIGHRKRVGKTTTAKFLNMALRMEGKQAVICHFADIIKDVCALIYAHKGIKPGAYYEEHPDEKEIARPYWIRVGDALTEIDSNLFVDIIKDRGEVIIVPDLRRYNELITVKKGKRNLIVRVNKNVEAQTDKLDEELASYTSWDFDIWNDGTVVELQHKLQPVVRRICETS